MSEEKKSTEEPKKKETEVKGRHWTGVIYPESMPSDWEEIITQTHIPCVLSPLHDKDVTAIGETKKAHYHILMTFGNTTTHKNASDLIQALGVTLKAEVVKSVEGIYRYLTHADNADKYQYDPNEIRCFNGWSYEDMIGGYTKTQKRQITKKIRLLIQENLFPPNYIAMLDYLESEGYWEELDWAEDHTFYCKEILFSARKYKEDLVNWQIRNGVLPSTGEVVEPANSDAEEEEEEEA